MKKIIFYTTCFHLFLCLAIQPSTAMDIQSSKNPIIDATGKTLIQELQRVSKGLPYEKEAVLNAYEEFSRSLKTLGDRADTGGIHIPIFGDFAQILLDMVKAHETFDIKTLYRWRKAKGISHFEAELKDRQEKLQTSYNWFLPFSHRLTMLSTILSTDRYCPGFNTKSDAYNRHLIKLGSMDSYNNYLQACEIIGDKHTRDFASPTALMKLFPNICILPCIIPLTDWDIVKHMPSEKRDINLWLVSFILNHEQADGAILSPADYFMHDLDHAAAFRHAFSNISFDVSNITDLALIDDKLLQKSYEHIKESRYFFDSLLTNTINILENCPINEREKRVYEFFTFIWAHEFIKSGRDLCITAVASDLIYDRCSYSNFKYIKDDKYYRKLLPLPIQKLSNKELEIEFQIYTKKYYDFMNDIHSPNHLRKDIADWYRITDLGDPRLQIINSMVSPYSIKTCSPIELTSFPNTIQFINPGYKRNLKFSEDYSFLQSVLEWINFGNPIKQKSYLEICCIDKNPLLTGTGGCNNHLIQYFPGRNDLKAQQYFEKHQSSFNPRLSKVLTPNQNLLQKKFVNNRFLPRSQVGRVFGGITALVGIGCIASKYFSKPSGPDK